MPSSSTREHSETTTATEQKPPPDLIVGIDLGTTFTSVSYCVPHPGKLDPPPVINKWPGWEDKIANRVPTMLSAGTGTWGYQTLRLRTAGHQDVAIKERFKLLLDKRQLAKLNSAIGRSQAELSKASVDTWFKNYLQKLYEWITQELGSIRQKKLEDMKVDFLFSVPTTWDQETKDDYLNIIKVSGFGSVDNQMHTPSISLNEAEATAIFIALCHPKKPEHEFKEDDLVLVCDAGGATTDVSALKVMKFEGKTPIFEQKSQVKGIPIGSIIIDELFDEYISTHLQSLNFSGVQPSSEELFQDIKASLGTGIADGVKTFRIPIPGLPKSFSDPKTRISEGCVKVERNVIEAIFDRLLGHTGEDPGDGPKSDSDESNGDSNGVPKGIYGLIDRQIGKLAGGEPPGRVDFLIISGGLGSSKYIQRRLRQRYGPDGAFREKIKIIIADDPQLVVCRGLVMNRLRELYSMKPIIRKRGCPASYGLVWDMPFDEKQHAEFKNEAIVMKPDRRLYLPDRIQWFIKQDDLLDCEDELEFPFTRTVHYNNAATLKHDIVRCDKRENLPEKVVPNAVKLVCTFSGALKNGRELRHSAGVRKEQRFKFPIIGGFGLYLQVEYKVRVKVEGDGLKFGIRFNGKDLGGVGEVAPEWNAELVGFEAE